MANGRGKKAPWLREQRERHEPLVLVGNNTDLIASLEDGSVDLVVSSPPFWRLRSYIEPDALEKAHEHGQEPSPAEYLANLIRQVEIWASKMSPYASLAIELGDARSGSGGGGGDYLPGGMREGQQAFRGTGAAAREFNREHWRQKTAERRHGANHPCAERERTRTPPPGHPLETSLCFVPQLFGASLAYGRNLLAPDQVFDQWKVRNVVRWVKRNPAVGAIADRWRDATSEITVATRSEARYWDDLATRKVSGAPLQDWWDVTPTGYTSASGGHYATFPEDLLVPLIEAMCPRRACRTCGEPSRRLVNSVRTFDGEPASPGMFGSKERNIQAEGVGHYRFGTERNTLGWTGCSCVKGLWVPDFDVDGTMTAIMKTKRVAVQAERADNVEEAKRLRKIAAAMAESVAGAYLGDLEGWHQGDIWRPGCVLDPYLGSGTTAVVARSLGRMCVGTELNPHYAELARERLAVTQGMAPAKSKASEPEGPTPMEILMGLAPG